MKSFYKLAFLLFVFITGCVTTVNSHFEFSNYRSVPMYSNPSTYKEIIVYVDKDFNSENITMIDEAINEWNYVLNGAAKFKVVHWDLDKDSLLGQRIIGFTGKDPERVIMLNLNSDNTMAIDDLARMPKESRSRVLAYNSKRGEDLHINFLVILKNRVGNYDYHKMLLHEFGHVLNADHVNMLSLMHPYNGPNETTCIDFVTASQAAFSLKVSVSHMNYCTPKDIYN